MHENQDGLTVKLAGDLKPGDRVEESNGTTRTVMRVIELRGVTARGVHYVAIDFIEDARLNLPHASRQVHPGAEVVVVPWPTMWVEYDPRGSEMEAFEMDDDGWDANGGLPVVTAGNLTDLIAGIDDGALIHFPTHPVFAS